MANTLILNQPQVSVGLSSFTFTIPTTGLYSVIVSALVPEALAPGAGAGTGADQGDGVTGGQPGAQRTTDQTLGQGQTGLGTSFPTPIPLATTIPNLDSVSTGGGHTGVSALPGATADGASGKGSGYGAGAGGGDLDGFSRGANGTGFGGVGQGFGPAVGYPQPGAYTNTPTTGPAVSSALSLVVAKNASTIYTSTGFTAQQSAQQFKFGFSATATDTITVTPSSANASDNTLNGVKLTVTIQQGL